MNNSGIGEWVKFFCKRVLELAFLAGWFIGAWALHEFVIKPFPLEGLSKLMSYAFEGAFSVSTLFELFKLIFSNWKGERYPPWWR